MHVRSKCFCASLIHSVFSKKQQLVARSFRQTHTHSYIQYMSKQQKESHACRELRHLALTQSLHLRQHDVSQPHYSTSTWRDTTSDSTAAHTDGCIQFPCFGRVLPGTGWRGWGEGSPRSPPWAARRRCTPETRPTGRGTHVTQLITKHSTPAGVQKSSQCRLGQTEIIREAERETGIMKDAEADVCRLNERILHSVWRHGETFSMATFGFKTYALF